MSLIDESVPSRLLKEKEARLKKSLENYESEVKKRKAAEMEAIHVKRLLEQEREIRLPEETLVQVKELSAKDDALDIVRGDVKTDAGRMFTIER